MDTEGSIKGYLDSLSQVPGSILWRDRLAWKGLIPGSAGQVLALDDDLNPKWISKQTFTTLAVFYKSTNSNFNRGLASGTGAFTCNGFFRVPSRAGTSARLIFGISNNSATTQKIGIFVGDASHALAPNRFYVRSQNSSAGEILSARPAPNVANNLMHSFHVAFNPATGASLIVLDRTVYTANTSISGSHSYTANFWRTGSGNGLPGASTNFWVGPIGFKYQYRTNWQDFSTTDNKPAILDTGSWSEWGGIPQVYHPWGELADNYGSNGDWDRSQSSCLTDPYL